MILIEGSSIDLFSVLLYLFLFKQCLLRFLLLLLFFFIFTVFFVFPVSSMLF